MPNLNLSNLKDILWTCGSKLSQRNVQSMEHLVTQCFIATPQGCWWPTQCNADPQSAWIECSYFGMRQHRENSILHKRGCIFCWFVNMDATRFYIDLSSTVAWKTLKTPGLEPWALTTYSWKKQEQVSCIFKTHQKARVVSGSGEINTVQYCTLSHMGAAAKDRHYPGDGLSIVHLEMNYPGNRKPADRR